MLAAGEPLPLAGEGDHAKHVGGGCPNHRRKMLPPSVAFGATFPGKREKDPTARPRST